MKKTTFKHTVYLLFIFTVSLRAQNPQDTLSIGYVKDEVRIIVPFLYRTNAEANISKLVWGDGLFYDATRNGLIRNFRWFDNYTRWQITISDSIKFNNDSLLSPEDVKFTLEFYNWYVKNNGYIYDEILWEFKNLTISDSTNFEITFLKPVKNLQNALRDIPILPSEVYKKESYRETLDFLFNSLPVGRGEFKVITWDKGDKLLLERISKVDNTVNIIQFRLFDDDSLLRNEFIRGNLDYITLYDRGNSLAVKNADRQNILITPFKLVQDRMIPYFYISFNIKKRFFRSQRLRTALTHTIDKSKMLPEEPRDFQSRVIASSPISPLSPVYFEDSEKHNYNPEDASNELRRLGWTDSNNDGILDKDGSDFTFRLIFPGRYGFIHDIVRQIQLNMNEVGINVTPIPLSQAEIEDRVDSLDYDAALEIAYSKPRNTYSTFKEFFRYRGVSKKNHLNYKEPGIHNALYYARTTSNETRMKDNYRTVQKIIIDGKIGAFLFHQQKMYYLVRIERFENIINTNYVLPIERWKIKRQNRQ